MPNAMPLGYRITGSCSRERRMVDYDRAFAAYAACDSQAQIETEGFLSPFQYDDAMRSRIVDEQSMTLDVVGFDGPCWSRFVWFDIDDAGNLDGAANSAQRLCSTILDRYTIDEDELLIFFSGAKGFHVGLPISLTNANESTDFHKVARQFAENIAGTANVKIDTAIYNKVQPLRAPNSRHGKSRRHKRFLTLDELVKLGTPAIVARAAEPIVFELPNDPEIDQRAVEDWVAATEFVQNQSVLAVERQSDRTALNRATLDFICDGASEGERHNRLYSAAANLAEFDCPLPLAYALLTEGAMNSGLGRAEVQRTVRDAIQSKGGAR